MSATLGPVSRLPDTHHLQKLRIRQYHLDQSHLGSAIVNRPQLQSRLFDDDTELGRRALDAIDHGHHREVTLVRVPRVVSPVGRKRRWCCDKLFRPTSRVHHLITNSMSKGAFESEYPDDLPNQNSRSRAHAGLDGGENADAVVIAPVMLHQVSMSFTCDLSTGATYDDVPKPVDVSILGRVDVEEVVRCKRDSVLCESVRMLGGPDDRFRLLQDWCSVLDDELQLGLLL